MQNNISLLFINSPMQVPLRIKYFLMHIKKHKKKYKLPLHAIKNTCIATNVEEISNKMNVINCLFI